MPRLTVAIACESERGLEGNVSGHFGHTPHFLVAELEDGKVLSTKLVASPGHGEGGCSMPQFVRQLGAQAIVVGGLGPRAADLLASVGIEVLAGVSGNAGEALKALAAGALEKGEPACGGHGEGGGCGHHHGGGHHHHHD